MANEPSQKHDPRQELIQALRKHSLSIHDNEDIKLSSGRMSRYYVNLKNLLLTQEGMEIVGATLHQHLQNIKFKAVGGPEFGGLLAAVAYAQHQKSLGLKMHSFFVRKKPKEYGISKGQAIERPKDLRPGDDVIVVDDVVTQGGSMLDALDQVEELGFNIVKVVAVLDREEGGGERILARGYDYSCLVTLKELTEESDAHRRLEAITQ